MAQTPWLSPLMVQPKKEEDLFLAGLMPQIPDLPKMVQDVSPAVPEPNPPPDQIGAKQVAEPQLDSFKVSQSISSSSPELAQLADQLRGRLEVLGQDRLGVEEAGVSDYQKMLQDYMSKGRGTDWTPLAGLLDQWAGGTSATQAAQAMKPETAKEKLQSVEAMKKNLQSMKSAVSDRQYKMLESQLNSVIAEMKQKAAEASLVASQGKFREAEDRRKAEQAQKFLEQFGKNLQPFEKVDNTIADLEKEIGFRLNDYDVKSGTVNGEPVNIPGSSAPLIGRVNFATPEGRRFGQKVQKIVNTVLKERSGAAVTDSEMMRILEEFGTSRGKAYTEQDVMSALKALADVLQKDKENVIQRADRDAVRAYFDNKEFAEKFQRKGGATRASGGLTPEEQAELEALEKEGY